MHLLPDLPDALVRHVFATLCAALPIPADDTPEARARRDEAASAALVALRPADAFEAQVASQIVAFHAHAMDCLRLAGLPGQDLREALRWRAQALAMIRVTQNGLRTLGLRAARRKAAAGRRAASVQPRGYRLSAASEVSGTA